jgi:hypothetical protein
MALKMPERTEGGAQSLDEINSGIQSIVDSGSAFQTHILASRNSRSTFAALNWSPMAPSLEK